MISKKIKCKFTIRARTTCYLLQMERQALDKMKIEFPEVFDGLMAEELKSLFMALKQKAAMHFLWEKEKNKVEDDEDEYSESDLSSERSSDSNSF